MLIRRFSNIKDEPVTFLFLERKMAEHRIVTKEDDLYSDLEKLREQEVVELKNTDLESTYALTIPLFGQWMDHNEDFHGIEKAAREVAL